MYVHHKPNFDKQAKAFNRERIVFSKKMLEQLDIYMQNNNNKTENKKNKNLDSDSTTFTKINSKWTID